MKKPESCGQHKSGMSTNLFKSNFRKHRQKPIKMIAQNDILRFVVVSVKRI